ncbi:hypothetical protein CALCODRAFT_542270, partial [Calocera cornea HHB12733]
MSNTPSQLGPEQADAAETALSATEEHSPVTQDEERACAVDASQERRVQAIIGTADPITVPMGHSRRPPQFSTPAQRAAHTQILAEADVNPAPGLSSYKPLGHPENADPTPNVILQVATSEVILISGHHRFAALQRSFTESGDLSTSSADKHSNVPVQGNANGSHEKH